MSWYTLVIPSLGKLKQEDYEFEAILCYRMKSCLKSEDKEEAEEEEV
jgi:hypothetical protein